MQLRLSFQKRNHILCGDASSIFSLAIANISAFKDRKNNKFLKKSVMVVIQNLQLHDQKSGCGFATAYT